MDKRREDSEQGHDWVGWHRQYDDPESGLSWRLQLIQQRIRQALVDLPPGRIRAISLCAGQGRDLIGALAGHRRRDDVIARLVEADPRNAAFARDLALRAGLPGVEVVTGDASMTSSFEGAVPAELILVCGIFGNIIEEDIRTTIGFLGTMAAPRAVAIWTRHRQPPDLTPAIGQWFTEAGFEEVAFDVFPAGVQTVGVHRLVSDPRPIDLGVKLFDFVGYDSLRQHPRKSE